MAVEKSNCQTLSGRREWGNNRKFPLGFNLVIIIKQQFGMVSREIKRFGVMFELLTKPNLPYLLGGMVVLYPLQ